MPKTKYYKNIVPKESDKGQPMHSGQTMAVRIATGYDIRECKSDKYEVTVLLNKINSGEDFVMPEGAEQREIVDFRKFKYFKFWCEAWQSGVKAFEACNPIPMVVETHADVANDNSEIVGASIVKDGICGFAWINIKPGTSSFSRWLAKEGYAYADKSRGGITLSIMYKGSQSMARKVAMAYAMMDVFRTYFPELMITVLSNPD